jgi:hypothetical protein
MALVDEKALRALHQLVPANEKWYVIQPRGEPAQECYCG